MAEIKMLARRSPGLEALGEILSLSSFLLKLLVFYTL